MKDAFNRIIEISTLSGIKGIEVVAKDNKAAMFYKKLGFVPLTDTKNLLFLPMGTVMNASQTSLTTPKHVPIY